MRRTLILCLLLLLSIPMQSQQDDGFGIVQGLVISAIESGTTTLDLSGFNLEILPPETYGLTRVEVLNLSDNQLVELAPAIGKLTRLRSLNLERNQLATLPRTVENWTSICTLQLNDNRLVDLPFSMATLETRQRDCDTFTLNLDDNPLGPRLANAYGESTAAVFDYLANPESFRVGLTPLQLSIGFLVVVSLLIGLVFAARKFADSDEEDADAIDVQTL